jgi:ADP-ribose pyrophosphatase YjhB (NUDIX family)
VVLREGAVTGAPEILLGTADESQTLELPKGFARLEEDGETGLRRVLEAETGWVSTAVGEVISEGYVYDSRQTDHAWVESRAYIVMADAGEAPDLFTPAGYFEDVGWWPLDAETVNRMPSAQASMIQAALEGLKDAGQLNYELSEQLLGKKG